MWDMGKDYDARFGCLMVLFLVVAESILLVHKMHALDARLDRIDQRMDRLFPASQVSK